MDPVSVVVPVGPNPAPLTELLWQLAEEGRQVASVHVVLESEQARHWWQEGGQAAYDELHGQHPQLPPRQALDLVRVDAPEDQAHEFAEALFAALRRAQARSEQVIVALAGGRWRGSTALTTTAFQLLARQGDRLVDVRVDNASAEGVSGFFFPGQRRQDCPGNKHGEPFVASEVRVLLDAVPAPRLRPFLEEPQLGSFTQALAASREALRQAEPPVLTLDLGTGELWVGGEPVALKPAVFPFYAWVAVCRRAGVEARASDISGFRAFLVEWEGALPVTENMLSRRRRHSVVGKLLDPKLPAKKRPDNLSPAWSRARTAVREALEQAEVPRRDLLEIRHEHDHDGQAKYTRLVLELPAERIDVVGGWRPEMLDWG